MVPFNFSDAFNLIRLEIHGNLGSQPGNIHVENASFKDGLLELSLFREIPEHEKPRRIDIKTGGKTKRKVIEGKTA